MVFFLFLMFRSPFRARENSDFDFVLKGRGFSRTVSPAKLRAASAAEGGLRHGILIFPQPLSAHRLFRTGSVLLMGVAALRVLPLPLPPPQDRTKIVRTPALPIALRSPDFPDGTNIPRA